MHWIKLVFVFGKIVVICYMLANGIRARYSKFGKFDEISRLMAVFILILIALIAFDLTKKYIAGFYFLVLASNFINFLCLSHILRKLR